MPHLILTRDEGEALRTFEGKTVIPLDTASATSREWLVTLGTDRYCLIEEGGAWTLMHFRDDRRQSWEDCLQTVDWFLQTHRLILAN